MSVIERESHFFLPSPWRAVVIPPLFPLNASVASTFPILSSFSHHQPRARATPTRCPFSPVPSPWEEGRHFFLFFFFFSLPSYSTGPRRTGSDFAALFLRPFWSDGIYPFLLPLQTPGTGFFVYPSLLSVHFFILLQSSRVDLPFTRRLYVISPQHTAPPTVFSHSLYRVAPGDIFPRPFFFRSADSPPPLFFAPKRRTHPRRRGGLFVVGFFCSLTREEERSSRPFPPL